MNTQSSRALTFDEQLRANLIHGLVTQTKLVAADIAAHLGMAAPGELLTETRRLLGRSPTQLRVNQVPASRRRASASAIRIDLPVIGAYHFEWVFDYLGARALQGIEEVQGRCYRRRVSKAGKPSVWLEVSQHGQGLQVLMPLNCGPAHELLLRVARLFDLRVDGDD